MFARIATGWELMKQSFRVLRQDKELIVFPLISGVACLLVLASFALPLWNTPWFQQLFEDKQAPHDPLAYVLLFAFYAVNYFVIVFFNAALVSCALKRLAGGDPTVGYGLKQAASRLPQIAAWAVVSATVGVVLKMIESKSEKVGQIVASLVGAGWAIATYFVVPILVVERVGPLDALKRSTSLMRRTWGETLAGKMGLGLVIFLAMLPCMALVMLGIVMGGASGNVVLAGVGIALGAVWIMVVSLVSSAVQSILLTALYLYASEGTAPPQFDAALLKSAFGSKR
ncbi:MAG: DUF6159 family protein [Pirellulales bacterium]